VAVLKFPVALEVKKLPMFKRILKPVLLSVLVVFAQASPVMAEEQSDESTRISRGIAFVQAGENKKGIEVFKQILRENPGSFGAQNNLGIAYHAAGKYVEAIKAYRKALKIKDSSDVYNNIGLSYRNLGKNSLAIRAYEDAIKRNPNNAVAYMNLGTAYDVSGKLEKAIAAYQKSIRIKPDFDEAHYNLGVAYQNSGQFEKAQKSYERTITLNPDYAMARYNLGRVYVINFNWQGASAQYAALENIDAGLAARLAENFRKVPIFSNEEAVLFYDLFTIKNVTDRLYHVWTFVEFQKSAFVSKGKTARVIYHLLELDCDRSRSRRTKRYTLFLDNTKGDIEDEERNEWREVKPNSPFGSLMNMVCDSR
jgi:tetratricopeptide (TPR) repeat protein